MLSITTRNKKAKNILGFFIGVSMLELRFPSGRP